MVVNYQEVIDYVVDKYVSHADMVEEESSDISNLKIYLKNVLEEGVIFRIDDFKSLIKYVDDQTKFIKETFQYFENENLVVFPNYCYVLERAYIIKAK